MLTLLIHNETINTKCKFPNHRNQLNSFLRNIWKWSATGNNIVRNKQYIDINKITII